MQWIDVHSTKLSNKNQKLSTESKEYTSLVKILIKNAPNRIVTFLVKTL